jgi:aspartyl protease family protein
MRSFSLVVVFSALVAAARADELSDAKAVLEKAGVRVLPSGVSLTGDGDLGKELGKATQLQRTLNQANKDLQAAEQLAARGQQALNQLKAQHVQLGAQLAKIKPNDIALNNKLVGALKAIEGQFDLGGQEKAKLDEQAKNARTRYNAAREAYLEFVLAARKLADKIEADYARKGTDPEIRAQLARFNAAGGKQFELAPTPAFAASLKRLKQLEDTVLSEAINLRSDGQILWVNVHVDGKYQQEMVLDSGASMVCLPHAVAAKFGMRPTDKDPQITLVLADGREIPGRQMKIKSLRVGKFELDNVECAVLSEDAVAAQPLLGQSFLDAFKYEIDSSAKTLTMVKVK